MSNTQVINLPSSTSNIQSISGNTGGPISPIAGNIDLLTANATIGFAGTLGTETLDFGPSSGITNNLVLGSSLPSAAGADVNVGLGLNILGATTSGVANTVIGSNSLYNFESGQNNVSIGQFNGVALVSGDQNIFLGQTCAEDLVSGDQNIAIGITPLANLVSGNRNIAIGPLAGDNYATNESNNICINHAGVVGESNVLRIGTQGSGNNQIDECYIAGIAGVTTSNSQAVTIDSTTGQLGSAPIPTNSSFFAYNATPVANVTGDGTQYTCQFDTTSSNVGGDFASNTYTAPVTGTYSFTVGIYVSGVDGGNGLISIRIATSSGQLLIPLYANAANLHAGSNILYATSAIMYLSAGETVNIQIVITGSTTNVSWQGAALSGNPPYFSGSFLN